MKDQRWTIRCSDAAMDFCELEVRINFLKNVDDFPMLPKDIEEVAKVLHAETSIGSDRRLRAAGAK